MTHVVIYNCGRWVNLVEGKRVATILGEYFGSWKKPKVFFSNGAKDLACKVQSFSGNTIQCYPNKAIVTGTYGVKVIVGKTLKGKRMADITVP